MPLDKAMFDWFVDSAGVREYLVEAPPGPYVYKREHKMPHYHFAPSSPPSEEASAPELPSLPFGDPE
jgi:hypothetical protein